MHCKTARQSFEESASNPEIAGHLKQCAACNGQALADRQLRGALRLMSRRAAPPRLTAALHVMASRERARVNQTAIGWADRFKMRARDLMRPFALPAAGGLASAVVLFSALMPSLAMPMPSVRNDVPLMLVTEPSVKNFPAMGLGESELVVDVDIDGAGRMVEYTVVRGAGLLKGGGGGLKSQLENSLLFTEFTPATKFGGPASGRVRLRIKTSQITIRG